MTTSSPALWVVSYLSDGHFKATRHADGCGVLALAQRQHEDHSFDKKYVQQQAVVEDERYQRLVDRGVAVAAKDHSCVSKPAPVETVAAQGSLI